MVVCAAGSLVAQFPTCVGMSFLDRFSVAFILGVDAQMASMSRLVFRTGCGPRGGVRVAFPCGCVVDYTLSGRGELLEGE